MNPLVFNVIHVVAGFGVIAALGAICLGPKAEHAKFASILHGVSLVVLLLVGLHMLFSRDLVGTGGWWHTKLLLWVALGVAPVLAKKKVMPAGALLGLVLATGALAAYLGTLKGFI